MEFFNPVKLVKGTGVRSQVYSQCANKTVLIICSEAALSRYEKDDEFFELFRSSNVSFEHDFGSNPSLTDIVKISEKHTVNSPNVIIGLGGGSAMDVAKISAVSIPAFQRGISFNELLSDVGLFDKIMPIDCIQIPTTAGTGSEVTPFATVWDYLDQKKKSLSHPKMYAKSAYVDEELLKNLPLDIAISTGLDALNQAFESIWNKNATSLSLMYAKRAATLSLESLALLVGDETSSCLRDRLAEASLFAGIAISQTRTSICHSISYPLTLKYNVPHGLACAYSMIAVYEFNFDFVKDQIKIIEEEINCDPLERIQSIFEALSVKQLIKNYIPRGAALYLIDEMKTAGRFENNIRDVNSVELISIIKKSDKDLYE